MCITQRLVDLAWLNDPVFPKMTKLSLSLSKDTNNISLSNLFFSHAKSWVLGLCLCAYLLHLIINSPASSCISETKDWVVAMDWHETQWLTEPQITFITKYLTFWCRTPPGITLWTVLTFLQAALADQHCLYN